jgi:hypothetical protein
MKAVIYFVAIEILRYINVYVSGFREECFGIPVCFIMSLNDANVSCSLSLLTSPVHYCVLRGDVTALLSAHQLVQFAADCDISLAFL